jgi:D-sedoheptulose 7-phosphate isomerase
MVAIKNLAAYEWTSSGQVPFEEFLTTVNGYRVSGKRIITTNGCFDLLHVGHIRFLEGARSLGDVLIVGLNSDLSVKRIKGENRPLLPEGDRAAMLDALKSVDHVVVFNDALPTQMLAAIKPYIHCKAGDYSSDGLPEANAVKSLGGEICILPVIPGYSTSRLLERILVSQQENEYSEVAHTSVGQPDQILSHFLSSSNVLRQTGYQLAGKITQVSEILSQALRSGQKVLVCGNGGSAADAQHFAAELVVRYNLDRRALPAIALTTDTSILTASGNDFGFEQVFSRQVQAYGLPGDVLIAISTSGNSSNILAAVQEAKIRGLRVIGLTGGKVSLLQQNVDLCLAVPSQDTPQIQQAHIAILHILCDLVEQGLQPG